MISHWLYALQTPSDPRVGMLGKYYFVQYIHVSGTSLIFYEALLVLFDYVMKDVVENVCLIFVLSLLSKNHICVLCIIAELVVLVLVAQVLVLDKVHKDSQGQEDRGLCKLEIEIFKNQ